MDHQLHAAGLVEKPLEDDLILRRQAAERRAGRRQVLDELRAPGFGQAEVLHQPGEAPLRPAARRCQTRRHVRPEARHGPRQLVAATGRLAQPERDGGREPVRILHAHDAALHPQDAIGGIAELEDVAGHALDGEVLVHRADDLGLGLQQHLVVGVVGDGAAGGQRRQARAAPAAQHAVHRVVVDQRPAPAAPAGEAFRQHGDERGEILAFQRAVGPGPARQGVELVLVPLLGARPRRRSAAPARRAAHPGCIEPVELAAPDAVDQRRALDEVVAREREQPALGRGADGMPGAPDPLQEGRDRARRAQLAHQVDLADVDAELQRGGRHQRLERAALQAPLGVEPQLLGEAAVVGGHMVLAEAVGEVAADPLGHAPRIDEDERGAVLFDQLRQTVVDLLPDVARHHRFERRGGDLDGEIARPAMAGVDDRALRAPARRPRRRRPGTARPGRSASGSPTGRCAAACRRRAPTGAPARAPDASRACSAPARGSRRRSRCASSSAWRGRTRSRAGCRATPAS